MSPTDDAMILVSWEKYPSIARVSTPFVKLAGVRVEPKNHARHDTPGGYGIVRCATGFSLARIPDGAEMPIALPPHTCPQRPVWSVDGKRFRFELITDTSVELWVGDAVTGAVHRIEGVKLNPMLGSTTQWMPDQKTLLVKLVPDGMGPPPPAPEVPSGPSIQETGGQKGESSTYEARDTLQNAYDESLFDYYASAQLAFVDTTTGAVTPIGKPALYDYVDASPDGEHILATTIHKPYSYVTTYGRFPHDVDVLGRTGALAHNLAKIPLQDRVPVHGVPTGPRDFEWRATEPATLTWAEALDGGDWNVKVPARDKVFLQKAPFTTAPTLVTQTEQRFEGFEWGETPSFALLRENDENRHWMRTFVVNVDAQASKPTLLWDLSTDEQYANPGSPVYKPLPNGAWVIRQDGDAIFLSGSGASPIGDRPFLDRLDLTTKKSERLFRSGSADVESFVAFRGNDTRSFLTWHESPTETPNAFLRTLGAKVTAPAGEPVYASTPQPVTHIPDPTPEVRAIKKRLVKYKRKDGVDLSFTLLTPPGYVEGTRVPAVLYAYPLDYADATKAAQVTGSEDRRFTRLGDYQMVLLAGYAVIDDAAFPIVGDPKKAYDTYLEQLQMDAQAAVDKAVSLGVVDPDRIGVTGHSHGALMTANLVAHTNLFRAGVATSGSYNKTLTPFGFQNERRSVWAAQSVYLKVSPFFVADKIKTPLLLIHGADDANPGTTPLQATKLFEAIRGNGGTTRLVMLPHEPHWYSAMESNEQVTYEMLRWFDKYVKDAPPKAGSPSPPRRTSTQAAKSSAK